LATHGGGCNADVLCIRANPDKCLPKYLYYLFTTDNFVNDYLKSCKGAKMPRGDIQRLLDYEFNLPDLPTQLRIAGVMVCSCHSDASVSFSPPNTWFKVLVVFAGHGA
ncbi:MAG: restriction endonuclease subunit S, partial [Kiritimatiellae bacterium]|nr:restriction endonuclease subunit S [Kiritimatiellia bacterium]